MVRQLHLLQIQLEKQIIKHVCTYFCAFVAHTYSALIQSQGRVSGLYKNITRQSLKFTSGRPLENPKCTRKEAIETVTKSVAAGSNNDGKLYQ